MLWRLSLERLAHPFALSFPDKGCRTLPEGRVRFAKFQSRSHSAEEIECHPDRRVARVTRRNDGGPFKPGFGLSGSGQKFWQLRYYDHNVRNYDSFVAKLRYIHWNPVKRGLCSSPEHWPWSSFCHYATGGEGVVQIESQWTASRRERAGVSLRVRELPRSSQNRAWTGHPPWFKVELG
jgi:hypothetical protein